MRLSYIVTTYNLDDAEIRRCLNSLSRQGLSRDDYEVIVVDDESDVNPESIVNEFAERMNVRFFRQPHARQGAARNLALTQAEGDFIQIVDGDDYLFADTSEWCLNALRDFEADAVIYGFVPAKERYPVQRSERSETINVFSGKDYMKRYTVFGSCCIMCFRRELLNMDGSSPLRFAENTFIEDEEFVTRLVWRTPRIVVSDFKGYVYVQRPDSTTHKRDAEHTEELFQAYFNALDRLIAFTNSEPKPHDGLDRKLHFLSVDILRHALRQDDWKQRFTDCAGALRNRILFPLPKAGYSTKYTFFRWLSLSSLGLRLLHFLEKNALFS